MYLVWEGAGRRVALRIARIFTVHAAGKWWEWGLTSQDRLLDSGWKLILIVRCADKLRRIVAATIAGIRRIDDLNARQAINLMVERKL